MDRYAVVGFPVQHSWSPFIHGMFAKQTGQDMQYRLLEAPPDQLTQAVMVFFAEGGKGLNVTVPHKQAVVALVTHRTPRAEIAGAVNTIAHHGGELLGDNTDGVGLITDLTHNLHFALTDARILLIGAGGAARGVLGPLLEKAPNLVQIVNRDGNRAEALAQEFSKLGEVHGGNFAAAGNAPCDLVINATSAGLQGKVPPVPAVVLSPQTLVTTCRTANKTRRSYCGRRNAAYSAPNSVGACWWNKQPNRSRFGAASVPTLRQSSTP